MKKLNFSCRQIIRQIRATALVLAFAFLASRSALAGTTVDPTTGDITIVVPNITITGSAYNWGANAIIAPTTFGNSSNTVSGYYGYSNSSKNGVITIVANSNANISTTGSGIYVVNEGSGMVSINSNSTLTSHNGIEVETSGSAYVGNSGTITLNNGGGGAGIDFTGADAPATLVNSGTITDTTGLSEGIFALTHSGALEVQNSGTINVGTAGIDVDGEGPGAGAFTVTNTGDITAVTGGIVAGAFGTVGISNAGNVMTTGSSSYGIEGISISNTVTISNTGIVTDVNGKGAIRAETASGDIEINLQSGTVTGTQGISALTQTGAIYINLIGGTLAADTAVSVTRTTPSSSNDQLLHETVTIDGAATITNTNGTGSGLLQGDGGTLKLNLIGLSPTDIAALQAQSGLSTTTKSVTIGTGVNAKTYEWNDLALNFNGQKITLSYMVDPSIQGLATALDQYGADLPAAYNNFLAAAAIDPETALTMFSSKEVFDGSHQIALSNSSLLLASILPDRFDQISGGSSGVDFSALTLCDPNALAFQDTSAHLAALTANLGTSATLSDSNNPKVMHVEPVDRWGVWATGSLLMADQDALGSSNTQGYHATTGSPTIGADYRFARDLTFGAFVNYANTQADFQDGTRLNVSGEYFGVYGLWTQDDWKIKGTLGGGFTQYDAQRQTFLPAPFLGGIGGGGTAAGNGIAGSSPDGSEVFTDVTGARDFKLGDGWLASPETGLQYIHLHEDGYTENGAGPFDLTVANQDTNSLRAHAGFRMTHDSKLGDAVILTEKINASAYHEFLDDSRGVETNVPGAPVLGSFVTKTSPPERNFALLGFGLDVKFQAGRLPMGAFVQYDLQVGQTAYMAHTIDGGVRINF